MKRRRDPARHEERGQPAAAPPSWAASLVATVRQDEDSVGSKPAAVVRRLVAFGVETVLRVVTAVGVAVPVGPETRELLATVQEWVATPRRRAVLRERLALGWTFAEMTKDGGVVIRPGASPAALIEGAASHLAFATQGGNGPDGAQRAVTAALERLVLATSREQVARVIVAGIAEAGLPEPPQPVRKRRRK